MLSTRELAEHYAELSAADEDVWNDRLAALAEEYKIAAHETHLVIQTARESGAPLGSEKLHALIASLYGTHLEAELYLKLRLLSSEAMLTELLMRVQDSEFLRLLNEE